MLFFIFEGRKTIKPEKEGRCKEEKLKEVHKRRPFYNFYGTPLVTLIAFEACVKMCFNTFTHEIVNVWSLKFFLMPASSVTRQLKGGCITLVGAQTKTRALSNKNLGSK
jgi:hypothetical protein